VNAADGEEPRSTAEAPADRDVAGRDVAASGRWLIATVVDSMPAASGMSAPRLVVDGRVPIPGSIAGRLWTRLAPRRPAPGMLAVVNAALVLLADHDLAASTFGVRVAASTRADPASCVAAGLGVLRGPLHGGASVMARALLEEASAIGAARAVANLLRERRRVPGFGHKVYTGADPRATLLLELLGSVHGDGRTVRLVDDVCAVTLERAGQAPNVDLAVAALALANGMPADAGEAIMAVARMAGWLAHVIEEYGEAPLRFRPRASYVG
jgi:citrate synthase